MHSLYRSFYHFSQYRLKSKLLYFVCLMVFFWAMADGILSYLLPITILHSGFSEAWMGVIIGSSSLAGGLFDVFLGKFIKSPDFRKIYLLMLMVSLMFLFLLASGKTLIIYLLAMVLWGIYWDFYHFGNFDFLSKTATEKERSSSFGIIGIFQSLGVVMAPLIAGYLITQKMGMAPFLTAGLMLSISLIFYVLLFYQSKSKDQSVSNSQNLYFSYSLTNQIRSWRVIGKQLLPLLLLTFFIYVTDAFFWTIGPLIAQNSELKQYGGLFLVSYILPSLLMGWFVGSITKKFGKKRTALISYLVSSILIVFLPFTSGVAMLLLVFLSSLFLAISLPAVNAAYADYIFETQSYEKEIEGLTDFFYNLGWIIGPVTAGILAAYLDEKRSFMILGFLGFITTIVLIKLTPKKINLKL